MHYYYYYYHGRSDYFLLPGLCPVLWHFWHTYTEFVGRRVSEKQRKNWNEDAIMTKVYNKILIARVHCWLPLPYAPKKEKKKNESDRASAHKIRTAANLYLIKVDCGWPASHSIELSSIHRYTHTTVIKPFRKSPSDCDRIIINC